MRQSIRISERSRNDGHDSAHPLLYKSFGFARRSSRIQVRASGIRVLSVLCVLMSTQSVGTFAADAPDDAVSIERARSAWKHWDDSVTSMEVDGFRLVGTFRTPGNVFSHEDLRRFVDDQLVPLVAGSEGAVTIDALRPLTLPIFRENYDREHRDRPAGSWSPYSMVEDDGKIRVDTVLLGQLITTILVDGEEHQYCESIRQADLHPTTTGFKVENRSFFYYRISDSTLSRMQAQDRAWTFTPSDDGRYFAESGGSKMLLDINTGFVSRHTVRRADGKYYHERMQTLPLLTSANVTVPRVIVNAHYFRETGHVDHVTLYVINRVFVNREIDQSRFLLSVPSGTTLVDRSTIDKEKSGRLGRQVPRIRKVREPIVDARKYAKSPQFDAPPVRVSRQPIENATSSWRWVLIPANIAAGLVILAIIVLRKRQPRQR